MDSCSVRGDTVSQTNVLSFARINVIYLPELGGQLPPPDPPSRTPMGARLMHMGLSICLSVILYVCPDGFNSKTTIAPIDWIICLHNNYYACGLVLL